MKLKLSFKINNFDEKEEMFLIQKQPNEVSFPRMYSMMMHDQDKKKKN